MLVKAKVSFRILILPKLRPQQNVFKKKNTVKEEEMIWRMMEWGLSSIWMIF
jgi:hypothetical protein